MTNLFINLYDDATPVRWHELRYCLQKNCEGRLFDKIYALVEKDFDYEKDRFFEYYDYLITFVRVENRPTFKDFFIAVNKFSDLNDINVISNTDIYFDETLKLANNIGESDCYALSRWELMEDNTLHQVQVHGDSQDCWIIKGKPKQIIEEADFTMGKYGCDNKIAYLLQQVGYNVTNPSLSIKAIHVHLTNVRNYEVERTLENTCQPPYLILPLTEIK